MSISPDVVILTQAELKMREDAAFQRGVERGKFEMAEHASKIAADLMQKANDAFDGLDHDSAIIYRERSEAITAALNQDPTA